MSDSKPKINRPLRYILLDTNIFEHLGNPDLAPQIIAILKDSVSQGYGLALSQYSLFELLDTASVENEIKAMSAVQGLKQFKVLQGTLIVAGHLGCLYKEDGLDNNKQPERGDKIIAGTSIINNAVIFTTNGRDFPRPFFKEVSKPLLKYKKTDGREVCIYSYFLEPDFSVIQTKYDSRVGTNSKISNG